MQFKKIKRDMYNKFDNGWPIKTLLLLFPPPLPVASLFNPRFYSRVFTMAEILLTFSGEQEIGPKTPSLYSFGRNKTDNEQTRYRCHNEDKKRRKRVLTCSNFYCPR